MECYRCGTVVDGEDFCPNCGAAFDIELAPEEEEPAAGAPAAEIKIDD